MREHLSDMWSLELAIASKFCDELPLCNRWGSRCKAAHRNLALMIVIPIDSGDMPKVCVLYAIQVDMRFAVCPNATTVAKIGWVNIWQVDWNMLLIVVAAQRDLFQCAISQSL